MTTTANTTPTVENGATVFIPLNKLKKHPRNARKTPHSEASIEAKAASIAAKGVLQNLVVEPEFDAGGEPTGFYLVSIGEGRRQAQLLRVKRKEIKKTEAIRCVIDTANDAAEISLDENVTRDPPPCRPVRALPRAFGRSRMGCGGNRRPVRCDRACGEAADASRRCQPEALAGLSRRRTDLGPVDGFRHHRRSRAAGTRL
ncbi:ParB N-terminal domain-containing protein [Pseudomonas aeruginosa]